MLDVRKCSVPCMDAVRQQAIGPNAVPGSCHSHLRACESVAATFNNKLIHQLFAAGKTEGTRQGFEKTRTMLGCCMLGGQGMRVKTERHSSHILSQLYCTTCRLRDATLGGQPRNRLLPLRNFQGLRFRQAGYFFQARPLVRQTIFDAPVLDRHVSEPSSHPEVRTCFHGNTTEQGL